MVRAMLAPESRAAIGPRLQRGQLLLAGANADQLYESLQLPRLPAMDKVEVDARHESVRGRGVGVNIAPTHPPSPH